VAEFDPSSSPLPPERIWQRAYESVLAATDRRTLFKCVEVAEPAMLARLDALAGRPDCDAEVQSLADALRHLRLVKTELLGMRSATRFRPPFGRAMRSRPTVS
jgi:hypothetical protein